MQSDNALHQDQLLTREEVGKLIVTEFDKYYIDSMQNFLLDFYPHYFTKIDINHPSKEAITKINDINTDSICVSQRFEIFYQQYARYFEESDKIYSIRLCDKYKKSLVKNFIYMCNNLKLSKAKVELYACEMKYIKSIDDLNALKKIQSECNKYCDAAFYNFNMLKKIMDSMNCKQPAKL